MRYCGNCGASLSPDFFSSIGSHGSVCPSCGAPIDPSRNADADDTIDIAQYLSAVPTFPERAGTGLRATARRLLTRPVALLTLVAVVLLLVLGSALWLNGAAGNRGVSLAPFSASPSGTRASSTSGSGAVLLAGLPTPAVTTTTTTTITSVMTPTPEAVTTPTLVTSQPALAVVPHQMTLSVCVSASARFTVTNTGGGSLAWSASASRAEYDVSPKSGLLASGQQQTVTVSGITLSGSVTVSAPRAADAPQTVTITCTL
ncbi:MAG TPA: hypothetical protein VFU63_04400 [Ktedonobacterales bacterium]|nr:hypothetical protein [Ktedonobacterales bacterium]